MNPAQAPRDQTPEPESDRLGASHRIAFGTLVRSAGEVLAKPLSLLLYAVMARELSQEQFGAFIFGISLSTVLLVLAGLGMQELIARDVARDRQRVNELLWNVIAVKSLMMLVVLGVIAIVVTLLGYQLESRLAILVISVGVALEYQASTFSAVFQAYERQQHIAVSLLINRLSTAVLGISVLLAGGELLAVSILTTGGSAIGLGTAYLLMRRYVVNPTLHIDPRSWGPLTRTSLPLGVLTVLSVTSLRSSVVLLGLLAASSVEIADYGAAFRLIEATLFVSWSFSAAVMPWFSRHSGSGAVPLARGFEMSLKGVIAATLPLALVFLLFTEPLVEIVYGEQYSGAVPPLRLLSAVTVLWGINGVISAVLLGRDRPRIYIIPAASAIVLSLVLSLALIPRFGAVGAALTMVPSAALLAVMTITATSRLVGSVSPLRVAASPLLAGASMAGVAVLLAGFPWALTALAAAGAYGVAFLAIERACFPDDFAAYLGIIRFRRGRLAST